MPFKIKSFIASNGERFSQIYASEELGFPLFYPTAYVTRSIRLKATHENQKPGDYLKWLANEVIPDADNPEIGQMITMQNRRLQEKLAAKTGSTSATDQKNVESTYLKRRESNC
ncbi:MAG: hypothetical protein V4632_02390 [Pseudomonadota bacterium]